MMQFSKDGKISILVFLISFAFYLVTITSNFALAHDSVLYLNSINSNDWIYHPHHLFYFPASKLMKVIFNDFLQMNIANYKLYSGLNSLFGSLTLLIIFRNFRVLQKLSLEKSLQMILLIGFSFGFWFYSICIETYIIPICFLFAVYYHLVKDNLQEKQLNYTLVGLFAGLATVFHQIYVLLFPILLIYYWLEKKEIKNILYFVITYCLTVGISYFSVIFLVLKLDSIASIINWLTLYGHSENWWVKPGIKGFILASIGFLRNFYANQFLFAVPNFANYLQKAFPNNSLIDEMYLVRNLNPQLALTFLILAISSGILILKRLFFNREVKSVLQSNKFLVLFACAFSMFFLVWSPDNLEFWIPQQMIFWIYFVTKTKNSKMNYGIALILLSVNMFGAIQLSDNRDNNYYEVLYKGLDKVCTDLKSTGSKVISITDVVYVDKNYQMMFGVDSILQIGTLPIDNLKKVTSNFKMILVTNKFENQTNKNIDSCLITLKKSNEFKVTDITNEKKYYLIEINQGNIK